jgi:glycerate 2-kinase
MNPNAGILNAAELARHEWVALRELALRVADAGLRACDVGFAAEQAIRADREAVAIGGHEYRLERGGRVIVVGGGKATLAIARALERSLGERIDAGAIVLREGEQNLALERIEIIVADHPLPSTRSHAAARRLLELADSAREGDLVIASFTGGSSALASLPPPGVAVEEKRHLHELLLGSGAPIADVNAVRKHVSAFKGGRLAARAAPAMIVNLTVSDVAGDVLDVLTDPSVSDTSTVAEAVAVLRDRGLWDEVPASVRNHLEGGAAESPRLEGKIHTVLLATGRLACERMIHEAKGDGVAAHLLSTTLEGEARELGRMLATLARESAVYGRPFEAPCVLVGCGGESSVSLGPAGALGEGGPNREAAIAAALPLDGAAVAACFLDTDGSDGGGPAAGAIIDGSTAERALALRVDLRAALAGHRSGAAFEALGDAIVTGATGTNVNDLFVLAVGDQPRVGVR